MNRTRRLSVDICHYLCDDMIMIQFWRLGEAGQHNFCLACTTDGLFLGRTPLIERRGLRFVVREQGQIERLLSRAYGGDFAADQLMPALATVARALDANDQCLACIAAVHLRLPDVPNLTARDEMEAEDRRIKSADSHSLLRTLQLRKASPNDPKHPAWPAGTEGGRGGQFRPKDDSELTQQAKSRIARHGLRISVLAVLHVGLEGIANLIPGIDVAADVMMVADVARTIIEFRKLAIDAAAALKFAKEGPHNLEELQVSSNYQEFPSYDEFYKIGSSLRVLEKRFGRAGDGYQYHHLVTQGGANAGKIPAEELQNTENVIRLPTLLHEAVNAEYLRPREGTNTSMYQWLQTQPYNVQREEGLKILRNLHILM